MTADVIRALHENEMAIWSWSTADQDSMVISGEIGADALMGDDAKLMLEILNRMQHL